MNLPPLPPATIVRVEDRGEFFVRRHQHPDPTRPTVVLLHGWTASADLQFFTAYAALAERCSFVGIDHRGHGRGLRTSGGSFSIEDAADDAIAVARALGIERAILLGYSMGGPIALTACRRHPEAVTGLIVQATALEWRATFRERFIWRWLPMLGAALRSWWYPRYVRRGLPRLVPDDHPLSAYRHWLLGELERGDPHAIIQAGRALATFDARPWAGTLGVPAAMLVTTRDRLVRPAKQRTLARTLQATVVEVAGDHLVPWEQPDVFAAATAELVATVAATHDIAESA